MVLTVKLIYLAVATIDELAWWEYDIMTYGRVYSFNEPLLGNSHASKQQTVNKPLHIDIELENDSCLQWEKNVMHQHEMSANSVFDGAVFMSSEMKLIEDFKRDTHPDKVNLAGRGEWFYYLCFRLDMDYYHL